MKKVIILFWLLVVYLTTTNAQFFAEGLLSASYHKEKHLDDTYNPSSISINYYPK